MLGLELGFQLGLHFLGLQVGLDLGFQLGLHFLGLQVDVQLFSTGFSGFTFSVQLGLDLGFLGSDFTIVVFSTCICVSLYFFIFCSYYRETYWSTCNIFRFQGNLFLF